MKKFFAIEFLTIDGREYNTGDVVFSEHQIAGLREAEQENNFEIEKKKITPTSVFLTEGSGGSEGEGQELTVSVVITFHNQKKYIKDCLSGFEGQTIKSAYEIIAVVDASAEGEAEYIKKHHKKIKVLEVNFRNADKARNAGARTATGKYLCFFDGDDYPFPEYLEELYLAIKDEPKNYFSYARFEHERFSAKKGKLPRCNIFEWTEDFARYSPITNTPIMIRREMSPERTGNLEIMQDAGFCLKLLKNGMAGKHIRKNLWHYRHTEKSVWNSAGVREKKKGARNFLIKEGIKRNDAEVMFVSLISRDEVLKEYFNQIPSLGMPSRTHWFVIIDSNDEEFINKVKKLISEQSGQFLSTRIFVSGENSLKDSRSFDDRGLRIANWIAVIINQAGEPMAGAPFLFMVEDDTLAPKNAFKKLYKTIANERNKNIAYISGIECGRGFTKHTGACWLIENEKGEAIGRDIPKMRKSGIVKVGGCGWYCWIGRTEFLKRFLLEKKFKTEDGKMLGVDVFFVNDLGKMGFDCLVDFSVQCQHYDNRRKVWLPASTGKGYDIKYFRDKNNLWKMDLKEK